MIANAERLAVSPMRGSVHDDLLPGLRHLALGQAIYWFQICAEVAQIGVLALFYGGQDQQRRMLVEAPWNEPLRAVRLVAEAPANRMSSGIEN